MTDFAALLSDLEEMQKASGADKDGDGKADAGGDDKQQVAAGKADDKKIIEASKDDDGDKDDDTFGKAFEVTLADGTKAEAFDGTAMMKALHSENEELRNAQIDMQSAFGMAVAVIKELRATTASQGEMLKALQTKHAATASAGAGRRAMLTVAEKLTPGLTPPASDANKPTAQSVMMKAQFMARNDKLDWAMLPRIEAHQGRGQLAPADILARYPELLTPIS